MLTLRSEMSSSARILMFLPRWHESAAVAAQATDINGENERRRDWGVTFLWSWLCFDYICGVTHVAGERHDWWGRLISLACSLWVVSLSFPILTASTPSSSSSSFSLRAFCPAFTHSFILGGPSCPSTVHRMQRAGSGGVCTMQGSRKIRSSTGGRVLCLTEL